MIYICLPSRHISKAKNQISPLLHCQSPSLAIHPLSLAISDHLLETSATPLLMYYLVIFSRCYLGNPCNVFHSRMEYKVGFKVSNLEVSIF